MFSIIIPSYNRQSQINQLLESLAKQTVQNFEVIIVDDCSTQPIQLEQHYTFNVNIIRNQNNQGPAQSRNIGAKSAVNNWLLFLDDDDRFSEKKCAVLTEHIRQYADKINFIYHPAKCVMVNEGFSYQSKPYTELNQLTLENILQANKIGGMPMIAIKKDFFIALGGLSAQLNALEDYEFVLKAVKHQNFRPHFIAQSLTTCYFFTKVMSVSKNIENTQQAIVYIQQHYVQTTQQQGFFRKNSFAILAYPYLMNLSRTAAKYYFQMGITNGVDIKALIIAGITLLSPRLALNLKRFI